MASEHKGSGTLCCATANAFIEQMQKAGADVRMTLFLAKTKSYRRFEHPRQTGKWRKPKEHKEKTATTDGLLY